MRLPVAVVVITAVAALAASSSAGGPVKSVVMEGYDVVAYFSLSPTDDGVLGSAAYSTVLNTTTGSYSFRFSSQDNLDKFQASPWSYAPLYGGF